MESDSLVSQSISRSSCTCQEKSRTSVTAHDILLGEVRWHGARTSRSGAADAEHRIALKEEITPDDIGECGGLRTRARLQAVQTIGRPSLLEYPRSASRAALELRDAENGYWMWRWSPCSHEGFTRAFSRVRHISEPLRQTTPPLASHTKCLPYTHTRRKESNPWTTSIRPLRVINRPARKFILSETGRKLL